MRYIYIYICVYVYLLVVFVNGGRLLRVFCFGPFIVLLTGMCSYPILHYVYVSEIHMWFVSTESKNAIAQTIIIFVNVIDLRFVSVRIFL
jgi:hypothetical protein